MSGHAAGTLWVSNPYIESPCVAERRRSVGGPHVGRFSLAWWWLRVPYGDPILRPRMVPYRVSNPSRRTSGRSARAPSRAKHHTLSPAVRNPKLQGGADFFDLSRPSLRPAPPSSPASPASVVLCCTVSLLGRGRSPAGSGFSAVHSLYAGGLGSPLGGVLALPLQRGISPGSRYPPRNRAGRRRPL